MHLSPEGLNLIKQSEGFRSRTYLDAAGFPSIGYGHRLLPHESFAEGITEAQAAEILAGDVHQAEEAVQRLVKVALTQGQFDALTDFCFNLGSGRLASSTLLKSLNAGRYDDARAQLLRWNEAGGEVRCGLAARRQAEFQLWATPVQKQPAA